MSAEATDCIFCRIVDGSLNTEFLVQSPHVVAFRDIAPQAPTHVLIVPRRHVEDLQSVTQADSDLIGEMISVAQRVARDEGIADTGYRLLTNIGPDAGQTVLHLHWHLLGGAPLTKLG